MAPSLGILEVTGFTPAMAALDALEKAAGVVLKQVESNDFYGVVLKFEGDVSSLHAALEAGKAIAETMGGKPLGTVLSRPDPLARPAIFSPIETSPLLQQAVVKNPTEPAPHTTATSKDSAMADAPSFALGFIETQGFTAVFEAIDSACKAANVEVIGKEKLGGGYITIVVKGDVAAVKAAVEAGTAKVNGLGKLIAGHVIARPSAAVMSLLPKL